MRSGSAGGALVVEEVAGAGLVDLIVAGAAFDGAGSVGAPPMVVDGVPLQAAAASTSSAATSALRSIGER